jgi:16S rRNA (guanine966-N2)-methyltransferase
MGLRIISGDLKGRRLFSPKGIKTRPTADRLRENIFNIISFRVEGSLVIDLFAGTGAMGIEALSRGAASALFIDNDKEALNAIKKNIENCGLGDRATIAAIDIEKNKIGIKHAFGAANLVFIDPPYNKNLIRPAMVNLSRSKSLQKEALLVIEHDSMETIPEDIHCYKRDDWRKYGKTLVSFVKYMV